MRNWTFFKYFFSYILGAKTRQRLLFIAVIGLFLSSFSLIVIQGIMGGLQKGLISRSKSVHGSYLIVFDDITDEPLDDIKSLLRRNGIPFYTELETEVMLRNKNFVAPAKLHGVDLNDDLPDFLKEKDFSGLVMGSDLSSKIKLQFLDDLQIISPGITDSLMGEVPRFTSESLSDYLYTELPEVDDFEIWGRVGVVQNLFRRLGINQIRLFGEIDSKVLDKIKSQKTQVPFSISHWEKMNEALVWSLNLETKVMLILFISMSFLVAIAITSGLLIFYSKIRKDLMSFWILGMSQKTLVKLCFHFTLILSAVTVIFGSIFGYVTLKIIEVYGHEMMPNVFVERRLPINLEFQHVVLAVLIPFGISIVFSYFSFAHFKRENQSFASIVRSLC